MPKITIGVSIIEVMVRKYFLIITRAKAQQNTINNGEGAVGRLQEPMKFEK